MEEKVIQKKGKARRGKSQGAKIEKEEEVEGKKAQKAKRRR